MTSPVLADSFGIRWRHLCVGLRNRIIRSPRFQRLAWTFPLTRPIARQRSRALFDLCAGFVYSQILLACVRLKVCNLLADGPLSVDQIAAATRLPQDAALRLLQGAASLGLLQDVGHHQYALDDLGAALLANPSIAAFVEHHAILYQDLHDPVALLRGERETALAAFWPYATSADAPKDRDRGFASDRYCELMSATQDLVAEDILDSYPMREHRQLLDVGGGEGAFVCAAAARAPRLRAALFDLPSVAVRARTALAARGMSTRIDVHAGNFYEDPLPRGADIITLIRILHDHDDSGAVRLLRAVHAALPNGGSLLIAEPMSGTRGAEAIGDAYFGFYLLAMGKGRPRRADEIEALLQVAGFTAIRQLKTRRPLITKAIIAKKYVNFS